MIQVACISRDTSMTERVQVRALGVTGYIEKGFSLHRVGGTLKPCAYVSCTCDVVGGESVTHTLEQRDGGRHFLMHYQNAQTGCWLLGLVIQSGCVTTPPLMLFPPCPVP
jgi:hypothetical protein